MSKNILIDSAHSEETRVAVIDDGKLERYDFESTTKLQVKGNIYLAKVIRVEPSLQAAFVDYGMGRHGFLSFSEVHHDYFQIPVDDREELDEHINNAIAARAEELGVSVEELDQKEVGKIRYQLYRRYKIQEVVKKRQIMLVQVTKEERGNKGASLTTYISLAGRYCVLMPNTEKSSGVSRKITNHTDRIKLKKIVADLKVEHGSVVLRTVAIGHTKTEIKKDFDYLCKMWDEIRQNTLNSIAPCLIHEEAGIIKRSIRDMYSKDVDAIIVEGKDGYKVAKQCMKNLMPSHAKKVQLYDDASMPLFKKFNINNQIRQIYSTRVDLPSGGYLVINNTEALISVDVNSGKATRERNIAGTALKTNLEAAVALARQCKLRDLAGLIVVDFIDMEDKRDNIKVEKCLKNALRDDKAKIQVGSITNFGLLEFSRQRLRSSIADANMIICPHCRGTGFMWSEESNAIQVLRQIEETCSMLNASEVRVTLPPAVALYIMNHKRLFLSNIEDRNNMHVIINIDPNITALDFKIEPLGHNNSMIDNDVENDDVENSEETLVDRSGKRINKRSLQTNERNRRDNNSDIKNEKPELNQNGKKGNQYKQRNKQNQKDIDEKKEDVTPEKDVAKVTNDAKKKAIKLRNYKKQRNQKNNTTDEVDKNIAETNADEHAEVALKKQDVETQVVSSKASQKQSRGMKTKKSNEKSVDILKPNSKDDFRKQVLNLEGLSVDRGLTSSSEELQIQIDSINHLHELSELTTQKKQDMEYNIIPTSLRENKMKKRGWWQKLLKKPNDETKGGE